MDECAICLEQLDINHVCLECNHSFHKECIDRWVHSNGNDTCPLCRMSISVHLEESFNRVAMVKFCRQQEFIKKITMFQGCVGGGLYFILSQNMWCIIPVLFTIYGYVGAHQLDVNKLNCYLIFIGSSILIRLTDIVDMYVQEPYDVNKISTFVPIQSVFVAFDGIIFYTVSNVISKIKKYKSQILNYIGFVSPS